MGNNLYNLGSRKIDLGEIPQKIYSILEKSGWKDLLRGFLYSEDFLQILGNLVVMVEENKRFTPPLNRMLRAFELCPVEDLKVVILGDGPVPFLNTSDGLLFSSGSEFPSVIQKAILEEVTRTVYNGVTPEHSTHELSRWSRQGVLLLHNALTTRLDVRNHHTALWAPFLSYVMDMLRSRQEIIWVLAGKHAQIYADMINNKSLVLSVSHPYSAVAFNRPWDTGNMFNKINAELAGTGRSPILW